MVSSGRTPELTGRGIKHSTKSGKAMMRAIQSALRLNEFLGCECDVRLSREQHSYLFYNLICGRIPKTICVNDLPVINIDAELTKPAFDRFYIDVVFFIQLGCHTGSHHLLDGSNCAVMDDDLLHGFTPFFCTLQERASIRLFISTQELRISITKFD